MPQSQQDHSSSLNATAWYIVGHANTSAVKPEVTDITKYSSLVAVSQVCHFARVLEFSSGASFNRARTREKINVLLACVGFNIPLRRTLYKDGLNVEIPLDW